MQKLVIFIIYLNCKVYIMIVFDVKPFIHADLKNPKLSFIFFMQTINFFFFLRWNATWMSFLMRFTLKAKL